ncbi:DUF417 family protein [Belnapia sp. T18]|uniref:DUF417 family protein n=1 Tax=Belnapia arida TaxID=2804533 RepID=A0ABS1UBB1_9PROT|nr:DUF417 family protein [Belnapia arida]MBL6081979.1 DUF417 family protein [Belnapia arida]
MADEQWHLRIRSRPGILEISIELLIVAGLISLENGAAAALLAFLPSFVTPPFLLTTPEAWVPPLRHRERGFRACPAWAACVEGRDALCGRLIAPVRSRKAAPPQAPGSELWRGQNRQPRRNDWRRPLIANQEVASRATLKRG